MDSTRARVLVVDDNDTNRLLVEETLAPAGYEVIHAASGPEAIERFAATAPDCVLLDVRMPGMDGYQTLERLRELRGGAETPVLFLTALRDLDTFDRALRQGVDDFLTKPIHPATLLARVDTLVRLRNLDSERRRLYEELRAQRDTLTRAQLAKERLTAFLVHDLKSPIGTMSILATTIARDPAVSSESLDAATTIVREARRMNTMVVNLLDISKGEDGQLEPNRVQADVAMLIADVVAAMHATANDYEVSLEHGTDEGLTPISLDADLIRRVVENLVENGIRHARRRGSVRVTATGTNETLEIRVVDSGPGVPPELRDRIFDKYVQVDTPGSAASRGGRGLGLTFCKLAVEAHRGTISVDPDATQGTFVVRLPR